MAYLNGKKIFFSTTLILVDEPIDGGEGELPDVVDPSVPETGGITVTYDEATSALTIEGAEVSYNADTGNLSVGEVPMNENGDMIIGG